MAAFRPGLSYTPVVPWPSRGRDVDGWRPWAVRFRPLLASLMNTHTHTHTPWPVLFQFIFFCADPRRPFTGVTLDKDARAVFLLFFFSKATVAGPLDPIKLSCRPCTSKYANEAYANRHVCALSVPSFSFDRPVRLDLVFFYFLSLQPALWRCPVFYA